LEFPPWTASPILGVADVHPAADYYRDVLGFALDPVDGVFMPPGSEPGGVYAIVRRAGAWVHFQVRRGAETPHGDHAVARDASLYVDDVLALHAEFRERGASINQPPQMTPYGIAEMVIEDPNDYRIAPGQVASPTARVC
jgi:uncharacterized glyoxalase superfamily protein PhnB